ncbi:MAG: penicillin acylase family protein [Leptospiraceae bacterium]
MFRERVIPAIYVSLGVIILLLLALYAILIFRLPSYNGTVRTNRINASVEIYRDSAGMPHIIADNERDAYVGLGYAMAQDRLLQMDLLRRAAAGRLSEVLGPELLKTDILFRTITAPIPAQTIFQNMPPEIQAALVAFSEGINLAMEEESLPVEFLLLGYEPEPWNPSDSLSALYIMSWDLSPAFNQEILYFLLEQRLGSEIAGYLFTAYPDGAAEILTGMQAGATPAEAIAENLASGPWSFKPQPMATNNSLLLALQAHSAYEELLGSPGAGASNNWVIAPEKSATGTAIVANDMHLGHGIPGIWYQAHIISPELNVTGVLLPGVPFVIAGGNENTARGFTNVMLDDIDFYRERLDPDDSSRVMYRNRYVDIKEIDTTFNVKGQDPVKHTIRITPHGPIVTDLHPLLSSDSEPSPNARSLLEGDPISIRWTLYDNTDAAIALYEANRARTVDDLEKALEHFKMPAQNWVFADSRGNIGYRAAAGIPIRRGFNGMGLLRGWDGTQEWSGYVPTRAQPGIRNPKEGWIASANNRHSRTYPYTISNYYATPDRYQRIQQLLSSTDGLDLKDHQRLQLDVFNFQARTLMPYIRRALNRPMEATDNRPMDRHLEEARNLLLDWNLQNDRTSSGAVIYHYFILALVHDLFEPVIGTELFPYYARNRYTLFNTLQVTLRNAFHPFYTVDGKDLNRDAFIRRSFRNGMEALMEAHGGTGVQWKDVQSLVYKHPFGRKSGLLGYFFNRGPYSVNGSWTTVAPAGFDIQTWPQNTYSVTHGASQRMIYDTGNPDASVTTLPSGISGQFLSPHYDDQIENYINGRYRPSPLSEEGAIQSSNYRLTLEPE